MSRDQFGQWRDVKPWMLLMCVVLVCAGGTAPAVGDTYWNAATGNWSIGGNWTAGEPTSDDAAFVNNGGTVTIDQANEECRNLYIGWDVADLGFVHMTGGDLQSYLFQLGRGSRGSGSTVCTYTQEGGTHTASYGIEMCTLLLSRATCNLSGGSLSTPDAIIGRLGSATFNHTGGTFRVYGLSSSHDFIIGSESGGWGSYLLSGTGRLESVQYLYVGFDGDGYFNQSGASSTHVANVLKVGGRASGSGVYELEDGTLTMSNQLSVGGADGLFVQTGGTINQGATMGYLNVGTTGRYELQAGEIQLFATDVYWGTSSPAGKGMFVQSGGSNTPDDRVKIWDGTYEISGGDLDAPKLEIGEDIPEIYDDAYLKVLGDDSSISCTTYTQNNLGNLYSVFDADGMSTIVVSGAADLDGDWHVEDPNGEAPFGWFDIMVAGGGFIGGFDNVYLPGPDWSWRITDGDTLWLLHLPEPAGLLSSEPPADGTLPKTQNNVILLTFDGPIVLPPTAPVSIVPLGGGPDAGGSFAYSIEPDGATLQAVENGSVVSDLTWYQVTPRPDFNVDPFAVDLCVLRGDANGSCRVTTADYTEVKAHMAEYTDARYDLNGSGRVTTADYIVVKDHMGNRCPAKP